MPDTTTVRSLITSVTALANHLDYSVNGIYRWIKVNRIPGSQLIKVAAFYDVPIPLHLAQSDKHNYVKANPKPRETLPACLQVQRGEITVEEAAKATGLTTRAITLILANWGEDLQLLYDTLKAVDEKEISLDQAAANLQVSKFNIHALRGKYGFKPPPRTKPAARPIVKRRQTTRKIALECIAGRKTLAEIQDEGVSWRTVHRAIAKLSPDYSLIELVHWPKTLRSAYAKEIELGRPQTSKNLWKFAEISKISMKKQPKYPGTPDSWRNLGVKRMMVHVLLGDESVTSLAEKRGADPHILEGLFTSDLRVLNLTWSEVADMLVETQMALAELLMAVEDNNKSPRRRMLEKLSND